MRRPARPRFPLGLPRRSNRLAGLLRDRSGAALVPIRDAVPVHEPAPVRDAVHVRGAIAGSPAERTM